MTKPSLEYVTGHLKKMKLREKVIDSALEIAYYGLNHKCNVREVTRPERDHWGQSKHDPTWTCMKCLALDMIDSTKSVDMTLISRPKDVKAAQKNNCYASNALAVKFGAIKTCAVALHEHTCFGHGECIACLAKAVAIDCIYGRNGKLIINESKLISSAHMGHKHGYQRIGKSQYNCKRKK